MKQKIAIIGSGISGLTCAYLLRNQYDVTLYEQNDYFGGHTHTQSVSVSDGTFPVNTGFIVFNDWTYPNFIKLMQQLGVESEESDMSFSVQCANTGLEYNGTTLNSLFAQRRNLLRPAFWGMVRDILRFNKEATAAFLAGSIDQNITLGQYLQNEKYGDWFKRYFIIPMGAAIWSASEKAMMDFPFYFFVRFFHHHGMLSVDKRPVWRVLKGGSHSYVQKITALLGDACHLNRAVTAVQRHASGVTVSDNQGQQLEYDQVIFACHSDQALAMLRDASPQEQEILSAIPYQNNDVVLHTDTRLLPQRPLAWASWNYFIPRQAQESVSVTYNMNILQNFKSDTTFCLTLNRSADIDPAKIIRRFNYAHPTFTLAGIAAQQRHAEISGTELHSHYCGAYWFNGFHEDGVKSALRVCSALGVEL
ncbi:MAG: FAD-dependent oxidoreductase [Oceanospirillaceae bacterium]|nr:FAD-dependent oxidoreductase [Oceanospirillaceae bacterium]MCP5335491.1 FAD-dependent oxidoreductase [Oceanospirillaceae bacterium]MCP5349962.1 FAD-dependent oxidoreductase [Oceanospirillaceae bacterium]